MAGQDNLKPFKPGYDPRRGRKPKGAIHLSTRIQKMLDDDEFTTKMVSPDGKEVKFKGNPAEAIIRTAILKAMSGEKDWAEWLARHGYGSKQIHEIQNNPINQILEQYGITSAKDGEEEESADTEE